MLLRNVEVGHVVVLLLRNVEGWSCSSLVVVEVVVFVVKKC